MFIDNYPLRNLPYMAKLSRGGHYLRISSTHVGFLTLRQIHKERLVRDVKGGSTAPWVALIGNNDISLHDRSGPGLLQPSGVRTVETTSSPLAEGDELARPREGREVLKTAAAFSARRDGRSEEMPADRGGEGSSGSPEAITSARASRSLNDIGIRSRPDRCSPTVTGRASGTEMNSADPYLG